MSDINKDNYNIKVKFWGTRGSIPTPGRYFLKYGGNTPCVEIRCGDTIIILDAGTGIRELGASLLHEFGATPREYHILISHTHWDHIQGFPFFHMAYLPGNRLSFYGGNSVSALEKLIYGQMEKEYFPVSVLELASTVVFNTLADNPFYINDVKIYYTHLIHPSLSLGFRIEYKGKVVVYATDNEISDDPEIEMINERNIGNLIKNADVLIADCQYTEEEYKNKIGWGHTTINKAVEIGNRYNVKNLFAFHHDPVHTDEELEIIIDNAQKFVVPPMKLYAAIEKNSIYL